jgi:anti-anti-sigma regulatory factor
MSTLAGQWVGDDSSLSLIVNRGTQGDTWVVAEGDLNRGNAALFRGFLEARCALPDRPVRIDFSGVHSCDAVGLRVLIDIDARLSKDGDQLFIANPCPTMRLLIDLHHANLLVFDYNPLGVSQQLTTDDGT